MSDCSDSLYQNIIMDHEDEDRESIDEQQTDLQTSTTPAIARRLFHDQITTSPTLSKPDFMANAVRQMLRESPLIPTTELAIYLTEFDYLYEEHKLNTPRVSIPILTESNRPRIILSPSQQTLPPVLTTSMSPTQSSNPIQVVISRVEYTDKEREVMTLRSDPSVREFLTWQQGAKITLALIDNYQDGILLYPRKSVAFPSSLTESQIDNLYINT